MTKASKSFRLSDEAHAGLEALAKRYDMSQTAVLEHLILDRASVTDRAKNAERRRQACEEALNNSDHGRSLFLWGYNTGWVHFQTRHGDNPMLETLPADSPSIPHVSSSMSPSSDSDGPIHVSASDSKPNPIHVSASDSPSRS